MQNLSAQNYQSNSIMSLSKDLMRDMFVDNLTPIN